MRRARVATAWLGGCSGCHMSLLDLDERLLDLAPRIDLVFSPLVDAKEIPEGVDLALVEGAVSTEDDAEAARRIRARSRVLVALGDCAVTGNVTAMRNGSGGPRPALERAYLELADHAPGIPEPSDVLPRLLDRVLPLHQVVKVDVWLPGCPPAADLVGEVIEDVLAGRTPDLAGKVRFG